MATPPGPSAPSAPSIAPALVLIMAVAAGLSVSAIYFPQPLLPTMARDLGLTASRAGAIVTTAQLGFAVGLLLIVPLGDLFEWRRLIVVMSLLSAGGQAVVALAPGPRTVLAGTALTGLFGVVTQILVPYAATLASPQARGRVVGAVMSGLLMGILLARTVAGLLTQLGSWRTVYACGAAAMVLSAGVLRLALPRHEPTLALSYPGLIRSIFTLFREEPALRLRAALGAAGFATFSVLWTSMAFLLAAPPYGLGPGPIGLFGLAGAAGILAASGAGRLADRGLGGRATGGGWGLLLLSWLPLAFAQRSLAAFVAGLLLLDLAVQGLHISNQAAIYRLRPEARSRLTSAYMTAYFLGGASGSLAAAWAFSRWGWPGAVGAGLAFTLAGAGLWAAAPEQG